MLKHFFWQPRGIIRSLSDFKGGPLVDVGAQMPNVRDRSHPLLVAEVPGGKVIGNTVLATTADDMVLGGMQSLIGCNDPENHGGVRRQRFRLPKRVRGTALLLAMNGDNYFHWLFDSLPRWQLLQQAGWDIGRADWVILTHDTPAFQTETLDLLGVPTNKRLRCSKLTIQQFDRLIVPSMPAVESGLVPEWVRDFLRATFLLPQERKANARLYITRRGTNRRRLANEKELEDRLSREHQFQICVMENMSFQEQVTLFASARIVVAPHGAGLSNLVFSPPGGHLIELFHPEIPRECYELLAKVAGIHYRSIIGRSTASRPCTDDRDAEFIINIDEVMAALRRTEETVATAGG